MNYNTQNAKIISITEKALTVGIDVGSETHYARAFDWRNFEFTKKPLAFINTEAGFLTFKAWMEEIQEKNGKTTVIRVFYTILTKGVDYDAAKLLGDIRRPQSV